VAACILHEGGYYVVVYIGNGAHIGGMMVPFSSIEKGSRRGLRKMEKRMKELELDMKIGLRVGLTIY
jgi:hypothetical protein